jgi:hypothetical protein
MASARARRSCASTAPPRATRAEREWAAAFKRTRPSLQGNPQTSRRAASADSLSTIAWSVKARMKKRARQPMYWAAREKGPTGLSG